MKLVEEYCRVITHVAGWSCCARSGSYMLGFGFQLACLVYTCTSDHMYTHTAGECLCNLWLVMVTTSETGTWDSPVIIVTRVVARCLKDCSVIPYRGKRFISSPKHSDQFWDIPGLM